MQVAVTENGFLKMHFSMGIFGYGYTDFPSPEGLKFSGGIKAHLPVKKIMIPPSMITFAIRRKSLSIKEITTAEK